MTTPTPEQIAGKLTEAQRAGIIATRDFRAPGPECNFLFDMCIPRDWEAKENYGNACDGDQLRPLVAMGIFSVSPHPEGPIVVHGDFGEVHFDHLWSLTPLGLAVRNYLTKDIRP